MTWDWCRTAGRRLGRPSLRVAEGEQTYAAEGAEGEYGGGLNGGNTFASRLRRPEHGIGCREEGRGTDPEQVL